jgi:hypothetical protein
MKLHEKAMELQWRYTGVEYFMEILWKTKYYTMGNYSLLELLP